jgi:hypothetical protein
MIKKILLIAFVAFTLFSCDDGKKQEKALLLQIITGHDKLMMEDGVVMSNKNELQSIAKTSTLPGVQDSVAVYTKQLISTDDAMMNWMNKFNPVFTGKSHGEIMDYLNKQQAQVDVLNKRFNEVVTSSNKFIAKAKGK